MLTILCTDVQRRDPRKFSHLNVLGSSETYKYLRRAYEQM